MLAAFLLYLVVCLCAAFCDVHLKIKEPVLYYGFGFVSALPYLVVLSMKG